MAILYGLLRALVSMTCLVASAGHTRARKRYERLDAAFQERENECKAHEVAVGRPADYAAQLRLLKAFEEKERARKSWVRAARVLETRRRRADWLKSLSGRKVPYTFGLVDMALVLHMIDRLGLGVSVDDLVAYVQSSVL